MRKASVLLSVALVASLAAAAWMWSELRTERARNLDLTAQLERAVAATRAAADTGERAIAPPATATTVATEVPAPAAASPASAPPVRGNREEWDAYRRQMLRDPKYREALREQRRLAYAPRRANFIRLLGLNPAQADAIIDLQLDMDAQLNEAYQGEVASDAAVAERRARIEAVEKAHQAKLREMLGDAKFSQLQSYMETRQTRMQVDSLRSELTEANVLRDDQVEPLIAALHAERTQMQNDLQEYRATFNFEEDSPESWRRYSERQGQLMKAMNARMHASASTILTGAQLEALDGQLARELARFEAQQRMNQIQSKLQRANAPATSPD